MDFEEMILQLNRQLSEIKAEVQRYIEEEESILDRAGMYLDRDDDVLLTPLDVHMQLLIPNSRRMREIRELMDRLNREICKNEDCRDSFFGMWVMQLDEQAAKSEATVQETSALIQKMVPALSDAEQYTVGELRQWKLDEQIVSLNQELAALAVRLNTLSELFEGIVQGYNSTNEKEEKEQ